MSDFVEGHRGYTRVHAPGGREIKVNKQVHDIVIGFRMCADVSCPKLSQYNELSQLPQLYVLDFY